MTTECHQCLRKGQGNDEYTTARGEESKPTCTHREIVKEDFADGGPEDECSDSSRNCDTNDEDQQFFESTLELIFLPASRQPSEFRQENTLDRSERQNRNSSNEKCRGESGDYLFVFGSTQQIHSE